MNQQTKLSTGALKAAKCVMAMMNEGMLLPHEVAELIDRESGLAELLEAAQRVAKWIDAGCDPSTKSLEALQRAIAKAINPNSTTV